MGKYNRIKEFIAKIFADTIVQLIVILLVSIASAILLFYPSPIAWISSVVGHIMQLYMPLWMIVLIFIVVITSIIILKYASNKIYNSPMPFGYDRSRNGNEIKRLLPHNGLNWIVYTPHQMFGRDEYVWVDGPFCPSCEFELKLNGIIKKSWVCARCGAKIKTRMKNAHDEKEHIKQIAYADIYRRKKVKKNQK